MQRIPKFATDVHKVVKTPVRRTGKCHRCGDDHPNWECQHEQTVCFKCNKRGHLKHMCGAATAWHNKPAQHQRQQFNRYFQKGRKGKSVHKVDEDSDCEDELVASLEVHSVCDQSAKVIWVKPNVQGKPFKMELDTGSAVSVISKKDYDALFNTVRLQKTGVLLKTYTGEKIPPVGKITVCVEYKEQKEKLDLYVVETGGPALFGRDWLSKLTLDWQCLRSVNQVGVQAATSSNTSAMTRWHSQRICRCVRRKSWYHEGYQS